MKNMNFAPNYKCKVRQNIENPNTILYAFCLSVTKFSKADGNGPRVRLLGVFGVADYEYDIEIFRARFRKRGAWPKTLICFICSKLVILRGNRVRGARNAHRYFTRAFPEAVGVACGGRDLKL
jgi:hypothetical protein